ncbi:Lid2 complex component-like protein [Emericellopsis cladophorae]|uniref:Lid2 complex component-like protein n=1 Tax=Emericellopsis cladophorae TaxID=2686198 RepID=A0A9Q0BBS4_9HYPO|nr:Lid2 complex component-like protein [Emericellopsis cladophorae]KAI6779617.1 Lid2 complex component-like protein [Emericellopsis cladophorae]
MAQQSQEAKGADPDSNPGSVEPNAMASTEASDKELSLELAAGYGTRSRNRNGNSRINYAEDRDYDAEMYDYDHADAKKSARQTQAASQCDRGNATSRKASGEDAKPAASQNGSKEQTPSRQNASQSKEQTTVSTQPSRKRKAATAAQQASSTGGSTPAGATASKRAASSAQNSSSTFPWPETNVLSFSDTEARLQQGDRLVADDGTTLEANDQVYLVCEPAGEPYYLARIMEFLHVGGKKTNPVHSIRVNWFYRPKDIGRRYDDMRLVFATMHSDIQSLTSLRGKCRILHRAEISNLDDYRRTPDCFWYEKLYDRYIQKNYDLIPTSQIVNVPEKVKKVLDERWRFVLVEQGRGKELTSAVKTCKRCSNYCASNNSVDCAVCHKTYHMECVRPPLLKKPSRGFGWSCAACSRKQEIALEARHTPNLYGDAEEEEHLEEEEEEIQAAATDRSISVDANEDAPHEATAEQVHNAKLWPWRYLGIHCKVEDVLDYDDRIHPRAGTRIGPRHQAVVLPWPGRPVQYVKPPEKKKGKKAAAAAIIPAAEQYPNGQRPVWVQDMPPGYITRGEDSVDPNDPNASAKLIWRPPPEGDVDGKIKKFVEEARSMAKSLGLPERSTNVQDVALEHLYRKDYSPEKAKKALAATPKADFNEPLPTATEQKKFDEAIGKYGSELWSVKRHVKTMKPGHITRYYYTWKKTDRGQAIWSNVTGRKAKKEAKQAAVAAHKLADDVADAEDDSAFDSGKASEMKKNFMCQFCHSTSSRRWRRAPNAAAGLVNENGVKATSKDKGTQYLQALCTRCAELWRRYAIRWEDYEELAKKAGATGNKAWKRKLDEEFVKELEAASSRGISTPDRPESPVQNAVNGSEPPRKKLKSNDKDPESDGGSGTSLTKKKEKVVPEEPVIPPMPQPRTLPCAICDQLEPLSDHVACRECRLSVHRQCYGVVDGRNAGKWTCDMCVNDRNPQVSTSYRCVLCPVEHTEHELIEQPKLTHHKKKMSDKDREREKLEVQQARKALELYRKQQEELNRPLGPREPLKRTADNNWVHVSCAVFTPEVKFGNAKAMEPSEGIPSIARTRYEETCSACNIPSGACVGCMVCKASYHVECAHKQGHQLGFELLPVKGSRRDQSLLVTIDGVAGVLSPGLCCKDHPPAKTNALTHQMHGRTDNPALSVIQLYVQTYKQADLALTGTVRKANTVTMAAKISATALQPGLRRLSTTTTTVSNGATGQRNGVAPETSTDKKAGEKVCISCGVDTSPRWWPIDAATRAGGRGPFHTMLNGVHLGEEAEKYASQRTVQCHKCHAAKIPMRPKSPVALLSQPPRPRSRADLPEAGIVAASAAALRSPERRAHNVESREARSLLQGWLPPASLSHTRTGLNGRLTHILGTPQSQPTGHLQAACHRSPSKPPKRLRTMTGHRAHQANMALHRGI